MRTRTKLIRNLTADEFARCARLNMGNSGSMHSTLMDMRSSREGRVVMLEDGDELLGWAMIFPHTRGPQLHLYVDPNKRRKGYGSRIMKRVLKVEPEAQVYPWNDTARSFYERFPVEPAYGYRLDHKTER